MKTILKAAGKKFATSATARGAAQALDLNGAIASKRLAKYRAVTVRQSMDKDWCSVGQSMHRAVKRAKDTHGWY